MKKEYWQEDWRDFSRKLYDEDTTYKQLYDEAVSYKDLYKEFVKKYSSKRIKMLGILS